MTEQNTNTVAVEETVETTEVVAETPTQELGTTLPEGRTTASQFGDILDI